MYSAKGIATGRCEGCKYLKMVASSGWDFPACFCDPHKGKWTKEIKDCPKEKVATK